MSLTLSDFAEASRPGGIKISARKFLDYFGIKGVKRFYYLLIMSFPKRITYKLFSNDKVVYTWISLCEQFESGCINPSVIINKDNGLVATFTNLNYTGLNPVPAIKFTYAKLHLIKNIEISNWQKIATVAIYMRYEKQTVPNAWDDFRPLVPNCFTDKVQDCNNAFNKLNQYSWQCLEMGLKQIKYNPETALYYVNIDPAIIEASRAPGE
jgi:hypothetical protein